MQTEKALTNDIREFAVFLKSSLLLTVSIVFQFIN